MPVLKNRFDCLYRGNDPRSLADAVTSIALEYIKWALPIAAYYKIDPATALMEYSSSPAYPSEEIASSQRILTANVTIPSGLTDDQFAAAQQALLNIIKREAVNGDRDAQQGGGS